MAFAAAGDLCAKKASEFFFATETTTIPMVDNRYLLEDVSICGVLQEPGKLRVRAGLLNTVREMVRRGKLAGQSPGVSKNILFSKGRQAKATTTAVILKAVTPFVATPMRHM